MIFVRDDIPMDAGFWLDFKLALSARIRAHAAKGRRDYLMNPDGTRAYRVVFTKPGDPLRLFRDVTYYRPHADLRTIRAANGVGRPPGPSAPLYTCNHFEP